MEPPGAQNHSCLAEQKREPDLNVPRRASLTVMASPGMPKLKPRGGMGRGLSSGRPAHTQIPSEETGDEGNSEGHRKHRILRGIQQAPRLGTVSANEETEETAQLFRSPLKWLRLFPIARRYCARATFRGGCDIGRTDGGDSGRSATNTLKDSATKKTAANKSTRGQCQRPLSRPRSSAVSIRRRSQYGPVRGWPVLSWHFSPGAAPHVGQATASIFAR